jgi:hypothetical protein
VATGDVELTMDELRAVTRFAAECAVGVLPAYEGAEPDDPRPRAAVDAAFVFADGGPRSNLQRTAAVAAHRAAKDASAETARLAAMACGDAAAAAYLHPIARATQVGHILRAAACAARIAELQTGSPDQAHVRALAARAAAPVPEVLRRYPTAPRGGSRLSVLVSALDSTIRGQQ